VEVSQEAVSHEYHHRLGHLQKEAHLPGFRPGKAPLALLIKKYEKAIEEEVLQKLIPEYCQKAIEEAKIFPVELPLIKEVTFKKDAPLIFTASVDVFPEVTLSSYAGLTVPKREVPVTKDDVEKGLGILLDQHGYLEALADDHLIAASDYVIVDFVGESGGKPLPGGKQKDYPIQIGSSRTRPEIETALLGKKKGECVSVDVMIPGDDPEKEIAGKVTHFTIDIKDVKAKKLPPLDDEFAKDLGLSSLDELKEKVETSLAAERKKIEEQSQKNNLMDQLIALHPIEAPQPMVESELRTLLQSQKMTQASDPNAVKELAVIAQTRVKGRLILTAISEKEKIEVSKEELEAAIQQTLARMGKASEKEKQDLMKNENFLHHLMEMVQSEKTLDWVYSQSKFEAVTEGAK
jgi:trigger factor